MVKNALKMSEWFLVPLVLSLAVVSKCQLQLIILELKHDGAEEPLPSTIERTAGSNLLLRCIIGGSGGFSSPDLVWGRKTKELRFKNETDLEKLAKEHSKHIYNLHDTSTKHPASTKAYKNFVPLTLTDRGTHFCMSLKYMLFKIVHIKVKDRNSFVEATNNLERKAGVSECGADKFRCRKSGYCINLHYKCDGRSDCSDDSDENWDFCRGDPCEGKIQCSDGRCIPTSWCCDRRTDEDCTVLVRPSCCPPLLDPYDPVHWYNKHDDDVKELHRSNGSKYLFITICVVSAILSFVLFLFVISKVCGFDAKPVRSRTADSSRNRQGESAAFADFSRCGHSQCAIRREFSPNTRCLYRTGAVAQNSDSSEVADPLIMISSIHLRASSPSEASDQPPPYAEVVNSPPSIDKCFLDDLINAPPPPYSSTNIFSETESGNGGGTRASDLANTANTYRNNQSTRCDIGTTGDTSNRNA